MRMTTKTEFLTSEEMAAKLRISIRTLQRMVKTGSAPTYLRVGGRLLFPLDDAVTKECPNCGTENCAIEQTSIRCMSCDTQFPLNVPCSHCPSYDHTVEPVSVGSCKSCDAHFVRTNDSEGACPTCGSTRCSVGQGLVLRCNSCGEDA